MANRVNPIRNIPVKYVVPRATNAPKTATNPIATVTPKSAITGDCDWRIDGPKPPRFARKPPAAHAPITPAIASDKITIVVRIAAGMVFLCITSACSE